jgi:hypothetical protein
MIHAAIAAEITPAIGRRTGFWIIMIVSTPEWTSLYYLPTGDPKRSPLHVLERLAGRASLKNVGAL